MRETNESILRQEGWIIRDDLRREMPDLDNKQFSELMLNMEGDGLAEFKLVDGTTIVMPDLCILDSAVFNS